MTSQGGHRWQFAARFRRHAYGWHPGPAVARVKEAVGEIRAVARRDPVLGAQGAVAFLERVSPAIELVDSSSGAIGTAVYNAVRELVPIIARAPVEPATRQGWLDRLWAAHESEEIPYIESLGDYWGDLCASKETASAWADQMIGITKLALSPDRSLRGFYHGTTACLSSLYRAERYEEILAVLEIDTIWAYKRWAVLALRAMGRRAEAIRYAEACRSPWTPDGEVDAICEEILLSSGFVEEAYRRYGLRANRRSTYLATYRAVAKKYPHKDARELLADLVASTPAAEPKWFAAAKEAGLYDEALSLAAMGPCDPRTLTRAARDFADAQPAFAVGAGLLALRWLVAGYGYDITGADVRDAYESALRAADNLGAGAATREQIRGLIAEGDAGGFVARLLGDELGL
ncbi:MAG: hypothetical protein M0Z47_01980 [Actinomycetota bacterium]|nr:hypothetical protein [Actinomycetota bacterium]